MHRLVSAPLLLVASLALAGAPAPRLNVDVWSEVPLGAPLRVDLEVIMMPMPKDLARRLKVTRDGKPVAGRWVVDNSAHVTCSERLRLAFHPAAPLTAGEYRVSGLPRGGPQAVTVAASRDTTAPTFAGVQGAYCMRPNPLLGCQPYGIGLRPRKEVEDDGVRLVTFIRRRGQPYTAAGRVEAELLPYAAHKILRDKPGRYILTQLAFDRADNAGGRVCEVELRLPARCKAFPGAGPGGKVSIVRGLGTGLIRARCARHDKRTGSWLSRIDGVRLRFVTKGGGTP